MGNDLNFETFLFISPKKIILSVNKKKDLVSIYKNEIYFDNPSDILDFKKIDDFLNENIFKVEKILDSFVQNINISIFSDNIFDLKISVKKNNYNNMINDSALIYLLNDAKEDCKETLKDLKIIHILIDSYLVDNYPYKELPQNHMCKSFSLDLSFICLPENLIKNIEKILENYQISVNQYLSGRYVEEYSTKENLGFFQSMSKIIEGNNTNEVKLVQKISKNKGFFEKFFSFFS